MRTPSPAGAAAPGAIRRRRPGRARGQFARHHGAATGLTMYRLALVTGLVMLGALAAHIQATVADITEPVSLIRSIEIESR